MYIATEFATL